MKPRLFSFLFFSASTLMAAVPVDPFAAPVAVTVQCDWIQLPHGAANELIRRHAGAPDGNALHNDASSRVKSGGASRLDIQSLLTRAGGRAVAQSVTQKAYATAYDPPQFPLALSISGDWPYELASPACAGSFTFEDLGRRIEVEVELPDNGPEVRLKLSVDWSEHVVDMPFGSGVSVYPQPVFFKAASRVEVRSAPAIWQLAGLFTPPPEKKSGAESAPRPDDRVMLFVRATAPGVKHNPPDVVAEPATQQVLAEWIETDTDLVAGLLTATPDFISAAGMRASLEALIREGKARLVETAMAPVSFGSRTELASELAIPQVREVDPGGRPQTLAVSNRTPAGTPVAGGGVQPGLKFPSFFNAYSFHKAGTRLSAACRKEPDGWRLLELDAALGAMVGNDIQGNGSSAVPQPRWQHLNAKAQLRVKSGVPALVRLLDPLLPYGGEQPPVRSRKVLLFITVLQ